MPAKGLRIWRGTLDHAVGTGAQGDGDGVGIATQFLGAPEAGIIRTIQIVGTDDQAVNLNMWLFDEQQTGVADNAAFAMPDADAAKLIEMVLFDTRRDGTNNVVSVETPNLAYRTAGGALWFQLQCVGGTPTYASGIMKIKLTIEF